MVCMRYCSTSTNLELDDFMVVHALSINNTLGEFMGAVIAIGSHINRQPGLLLQIGMLKIKIA